MVTVTGIKAKWNGQEVMDAHQGTLDGAKLTIDHPNWTLSDSTGRDLASKHTPFHVTGTMQVTVTIGQGAPAAAAAPRPAPFDKTVKLTAWGGKQGRCVFQS
jgi:uncharacterized protein (DUF2147 family)